MEAIIAELDHARRMAGFLFTRFESLKRIANLTSTGRLVTLVSKKMERPTRQVQQVAPKSDIDMFPNRADSVLSDSYSTRYTPYPNPYIALNSYHVLLHT